MSILKNQSNSLRHVLVTIRRIYKVAGSHAILIITAIIVGLPFFWMISTAFKNSTEVYQFPPIWIPETLNFDNFVTAWQSAPFGRFYLNSINTTLSGVVL
jgi:ABC-type glycerol-3-phosphate transport system permease component